MTYLELLFISPCTNNLILGSGYALVASHIIVNESLSDHSTVNLVCSAAAKIKEASYLVRSQYSSIKNINKINI